MRGDESSCGLRSRGSVKAYSSEPQPSSSDRASSLGLSRGVVHLLQKHLACFGARLEDTRQSLPDMTVECHARRTFSVNIRRPLRQMPESLASQLTQSIRLCAAKSLEFVITGRLCSQPPQSVKALK